MKRRRVWGSPRRTLSGPEARRPAPAEYDERLIFECKTSCRWLPGLLPDRGRLHQLGQEQRRAGRPGPGFRRRFAGRLQLRITDLDPLAYALLFERFLNPERVSMPDFDIDFCQDNRWRVIEYVPPALRRGCGQPDRTFGTMSSKAVIRDVGRVFGLPYSMCDRIPSSFRLSRTSRCRWPRRWSRSRSSRK